MQKLEPDCMKAIQHPLPSPPFISTRLVRRAVQTRWAYDSAMTVEEIDYHSNALAVIGAYLMLTIQFYAVTVAGLCYVARRIRLDLYGKENGEASLGLHTRPPLQDAPILYLPVEPTLNEMVSGSLTIAIEEGYFDTLTYFLENGYDCNLCNHEGLFPLHVAAKAGKITALKELLKHGASVNITNRRNVTALHRAAKSGHIEAVKLLLEYGADTSMTTDIGRTALDFAYLGGNSEIIYLLISIT